MSSKRLTSNAFAVIIGVDDYARFDPERDLPGSVNDALAWWDFCLRSGLHPDHVRLLVSPALGAPLPPSPALALARPATHANIEEALAWLAQKTQDPAGPCGLLTFSGHGDVQAGQPLLCPSDTVHAADGVSLANVILLADVLYNRHLGSNVTMAIDSCHAGPAMLPNVRGMHAASGAPAPGSKVVLSLRGRVPGDVLELPFKDRPPAARVLTASGFRGLAYQAEMMGRYHGAFTWALLSTLGQWQAKQDRKAVRLTIDCATARAFSADLLGVLELDQQPELHTRHGQETLPVLGPPGPTSPDPDGDRPGEQLTPDVKILLGALPSDRSNSIAPVTILANGTTASVPQYPAQNTEYWSLTSSFMTFLRSATEGAMLTLDARKSTDTTVTFPTRAADALPVFTMPLHLPSSWREAAAPPAVPGFFFTASDRVVGLSFQLVEPGAGGRWSGSITFWLGVAPGAPFDPTAPILGAPGTNTRLVLGPAPILAGYTWHRVDIAPT